MVSGLIKTFEYSKQEVDVIHIPKHFNNDPAYDPGSKYGQAQEQGTQTHAG